jgi:hypothetical protein
MSLVKMKLDLDFRLFPLVVEFKGREYFLRVTSRDHLHMSLYNPKIDKKNEKHINEETDKKEPSI